MTNPRSKHYHNSFIDVNNETQSYIKSKWYLRVERREIKILVNYDKIKIVPFRHLYEDIEYKSAIKVLFVLIWFDFIFYLFIHMFIL